MKLGILGTGMIVQEFLPELAKLKIELAAILSTAHSKERVEKLAARYNIKKVYLDYAEMLADKNLDTIYIALPNNLHYEFAKKALLADKNIIVEKPCVTTLEEFQDLKKIAAERKKIFIEAMTVHYMPAFQNLRADLPKLGDIKIISMNFSQYSSRYDKFKQGEIAPAFDPQKAGGALMDINVYNLHFVIGLFGKPKNFSYSANIERGIDTSGVLVMDYGDFKAVCIGAKDCQATFSTIQGNGGTVSISVTPNNFNAYTLNGELKNFDEGKHRMIYEFEKFIDIVDNCDFERAEKFLAVTEIVSEILQKSHSQIKVI